MMAVPSLWVAFGEVPAKEQFANVHYRRAFLLLGRKSNLFWTRVLLPGRLSGRGPTAICCGGAFSNVQPEVPFRVEPELVHTQWSAFLITRWNQLAGSGGEWRSGEGQ